jgi:hypothetical protein
MASTFIGLNRGQQGSLVSDFTVGTSTGSTDVEVRVDTGKSLTREEVKLILEAIIRELDVPDSTIFNTTGGFAAVV